MKLGQGVPRRLCLLRSVPVPDGHSVQGAPASQPVYALLRSADTDTKGNIGNIIATAELSGTFTHKEAEDIGIFRAAL